MAEFQWWLLIVGLVAGGALVAVISMDGARRDDELAAEERSAEATFLATQLAAAGEPIDRPTVEIVLRAHADYLRLRPPDRFEQIDDDAAPGGWRTEAPDLDSDADGLAHDEGDDGRSGADEDLPPA
jgi:hypothetical protein